MASISWNWQLKKWPEFSYDKNILLDMETQFIKSTSVTFGAFKHIKAEDKDQILVDILSDEALKTSAIEGEYLDRDSIQESIKKNLGMFANGRKVPPAEYGISEMMVNLYKTYDQPLSHEQLFDWHKMLTNGRRDILDIGCYRTHKDPMQVVSGRLDRPKVHYEAPPSKKMKSEMDGFIKWFNEVHRPTNNLGILTRSGLAHFYFISIHPFEDGNGRIGRAIAEKSIALSLQRPALITLSQTIEANKKEYYKAIETHNETLELTDWLLYFGTTALSAQENTLKIIEFLISKAKFFDRYANSLNERQVKVIRRIFNAGHEGFIGGLSAENYTRIVQTSASTATRDLNDLVNKKIVLKTGNLKGTRYWLNLEN